MGRGGSDDNNSGKLSRERDPRFSEGREETYLSDLTNDSLRADNHYYRELLDLQRRTLSDLKQTPADQWVRNQSLVLREFENFNGKDSGLLSNELSPSPQLEQWLREAYLDPDAREAINLYSSVNRCSDDPETQRFLLSEAYEELDDEGKDRIKRFITEWGPEAVGAIVGELAGRSTGAPTVGFLLGFVLGKLVEDRVKDGLEALSRKRAAQAAADEELRQRLSDLIEGGV